MTNQHDCCSTQAATGRQGIAQTPLDRMRSWATSRQGVIVIGLAAGALALGFSWNWLVAIGAASLILSFAPCAVMCALGICMMGRGKSSGTTQDASEVTGQPNIADLIEVVPSGEKSLSHPAASQPVPVET